MITNRPLALAASPTVDTPPGQRGDVPELALVPAPRGVVVAGHSWRFGPRSPGAAPAATVAPGPGSPAPTLCDGSRDLARQVAQTLLRNLPLVVSLVVVAGVALASLVTLLLGQLVLALSLGAVTLLAVAIAVEPARAGSPGGATAGGTGAAGFPAGSPAAQPVEAEHTQPTLAQAA